MLKQANNFPRHIFWTLALSLFIVLTMPGLGLAQGLRFLVPAYGNPFNAAGAEMWTKLEETAQIMGSDLHVIFNPESGPGAGPVDPNYVNDSGQGPLVDVRNAGGFIIGYIATDYTNKSSFDVRNEVDLYYTPSYWRGAGVQIQGIFFDEMSNDLSHAPYYRSLRDYVRSLDPDAWVVGNPGTSFVNNVTGQLNSTLADYVESMDTLVTFEATSNEYFNQYTPPSWKDSYPADRFSHIVHTESDVHKMIEGLGLARIRKAGYVYFTDDIFLVSTDNPYDNFPSYWSEEVDTAIKLGFADGFECGDTSAWTTEAP